MYDPIMRIDGVLKKGSKGDDVKHIQEWLCFHGLGMKIDGDFGYITQAGVKIFQKRENFETNGIVDQVTLDWLQAPMFSANAHILPSPENLSELVLAYARNHLNEKPVEIGGKNMGQWVRLYMNGHQGKEYLWCAGFVSTLLGFAAKQMETNRPIPYTVSCNMLKKHAEDKGLFVKENDYNKRRKVVPGSIFLLRKNSNKWYHAGIVEAVEDNFVLTIEGNSNDEGSMEGREVCRRLRNYRKLDFIIY